MANFKNSRERYHRKKPINNFDVITNNRDSFSLQPTDQVVTCRESQEMSRKETEFEVVQECLKKLISLLYVSFYSSFKVHKTSREQKYFNLIYSRNNLWYE